MKKVIEITDMCCKRCAERIEKKLLLAEGVSGAKVKYRKGIALVETALSDEDLTAIVTDAGYTVRLVRPRKGIFE